MASTKAKTDQTSKKGKVQKKEEDKSKKVLKEDSKKQDNVPVPTEVSTMKQQDEQQPKEESTEEEVSNPVSVYVNKLNNYVDRISAMNKELKEMVSIGKTLERDFNNIVKVLSKKNKKTSDRPKSGFAMPSLLSNELYEFMKIPHGELVHRTDVTRRLNEYIKQHELRREDNKRYIIPDATLQRLLRSKTSLCQGIGTAMSSNCVN
jgi:chromatin remodeling complex protein RSC6